MIDVGFECVRASEHIGAVAENIDLAQIINRDDAAAMDCIGRALDEHLVILFRKQTLTPQQIETIGRHFGGFINLKRAENPNASHIDGVQALKVISNAKDEHGVPLGDGSNRAQDWHSDGAMQSNPATYTWFYARSVPVENPPATYWMSAYKVYEDLPDDMKRRLAPLHVIHHQYSAGNEFPLPPSLTWEQRLKGPQHPLVRRHPATGRPSLYLPHRADALVVGLNETESLALLTELKDFVESRSYWWSATLDVDDLVVWDNRPVFHRRDGWENDAPRVLWHLANAGEVPIPFHR